MNHLTVPGLLLKITAALFLVGGNQLSFGQTRESSLAELQNEFAMRFLDPEPHMALAKYYFDKGKLLEAFYTVEAARRTRFKENVFSPAFYRAFDGFDNSSVAEARLLKQHSINPDSIEIIDGLADIYISRETWAKAEHYLRMAIQKKPEDYRFRSGLATVLGSQGKPDEADKVIKDYLLDFTESPDGYAIRVEELTQTNPAQAKLLATEALRRYPKNARLLFDMGILFQEGKDLAKAEEAFLKAADLAPKSVHIQTWVGRFLLRIRADNTQALKYYLNAYFLDPHAYETEFVESRIQKISVQLALQKFEQQVAAGSSLVSLLSDPNSVVVGFALEKVAETWRPDYVDPVVRLMGHDNQGVRWQATQVLKQNVDQSFDERLAALLKDNDLRKRGLAAYIAVFRWKSASFREIRNLLTEKAQLLRFDALSALMLEGGMEGRKIALAHAVRESNPELKRLVSQPIPDRK